MIKKVLITCSMLATLAIAQETTTQTTFSQPQATTDEYGNTVILQEATIKTDNFKVNNFWGKFAFGGAEAKDAEFYTVSRKGKFKITVEGTSACVLDSTLPEEGCSGQKPFLLNNEVLNAPMAGTTDHYEVAFSVAGDYDNSNDKTFYPLDIQRDEEYYKPVTGSTGGSSSRGFFGFFTSAFDFIFSKTIGFGNDFFGNPNIADVEYGARSEDAEDRRQRYIANIMAGVERKYRMKMPANGATATEIDAGTKLNDPVSLLHYDKSSEMSTTEKCKFMFTSLSSDGIMCRAMSGFGMDVWMPFFNKGKINKVQASTIMIDTENSILAMTGQIENVPYMQDVGGDDNTKLGFLKNMLKPMTTMFGFMKNMMFGTSKAPIVSDPKERVYAFDEDKAMTMTFAVTNDGTTVDEFANFKLLKVRSVYGDMIDSCRVKKSAGMFSWSHWDETFYAGGSLSKKGPDGDTWSSDEWIDWCQEATGRNGMFDYLFDWHTGAFFNPFNWMKGFFSAFLTFLTGSYEIKDFTSQVNRGLILELKKVELDPIGQYNRRVIEILDID